MLSRQLLPTIERYAYDFLIVNSDLITKHCFAVMKYGSPIIALLLSSSATLWRTVPLLHASFPRLRPTAVVTSDAWYAQTPATCMQEGAVISNHCTLGSLLFSLLAQVARTEPHGVQIATRGTLERKTAWFSYVQYLDCRVH
jgi:hypothetical protein